VNTLINAKELRASFPTVVKKVRRGVWYTVVYRNRPVFQLIPVEDLSMPVGDLAGDPLYHAAALGRSTDGGTAADHDRPLYSNRSDEPTVFCFRR
jgi:prevent-host-death family protein